MSKRIGILILFIIMSASIIPMQRGIEPHNSGTQETLKKLRASLDTLIGSNDNFIHETENLHMLAGSQLYEQAKKSLIIPSELDQIACVYKATQDTYLDALECFVRAYQEKYFESFMYIYKTTTTILDLEELRQPLEADSYALNSKLTALLPKIIAIKEEERARQLQQKASAHDCKIMIARAQTLQTQAREMALAIKNDTETNYATVESVYIESAQLFLEAYNKNDPTALAQAESTISECISFAASRKPGSDIYFIPEKINAVYQQLLEYKKKNTNPILYKKIAI